METIHGTNWINLSIKEVILKKEKTHEKITTSDCRLFIVINRSVASDLFGKSSLLEFQPA